MAGIDAAMAGYGRYRCSYGPKTKIADAFQRDEVGHAPPHRVFIPIPTRQGGFAPSLSHHFHFDASRRVMSLPVVSFFPFRSGEGGHAPPRRVIVILMRQGGLCPSPSRHPSFEAARGVEPLVVIYLHFRQRGG